MSVSSAYDDGFDEEFDYDPDWDRVCSYPCHVCGEEDEDDEDY